MCFYHTHVSHKSSQMPILFFTHPNLCLIFLSLWNSITWICGQPEKQVWQPRFTPLKKTDFVSPSIYQLPSTAQIEVEFASTSSPYGLAWACTVLLHDVLTSVSSFVQLSFGIQTSFFPSSVCGSCILLSSLLWWSLSLRNSCETWVFYLVLRIAQILSLPQLIVGLLY